MLEKALSWGGALRYPPPRMSDPFALTRLTAKELSARLARREVSSEEVTRAHLDRIEESDGAIRAFTEVFHRRAALHARKADEARMRGEPCGPLHGLPVTVKECFDIAGLPTTLGLPSRLAGRAGESSVLVRVLEEHGAVLLGRTNISQLMLYAESRNPIFGQTANPWSIHHSSGGSSGGEAAAIAAGMSPLGFGTDIGGSIRIPAHVCGIAGLKPTLDRWSTRGAGTGLVGQEAVRGTAGPMARSATDIAFAMESLEITRMAQLDPRVAPLAYGRVVPKSTARLRVGYFIDDGWVRPSSAVVRAVERAVAALRNLGCEVIPFPLPQAQETIAHYFAALSADGGATVEHASKGDRLDPALASLQRMVRLPKAVRVAAAHVANRMGDRLLSRLVLALGEKSVAEYWRLTDALRTYRFELFDAFDQANIDVLLGPVQATPALGHGQSESFAVANGPAMIFNAVQFPAGVIPVTRVRAEEAWRDNPRGKLERHAGEVDKMSLGLPVGVQVVGRPYCEESVVAAMVAIENEVKGDVGFPKTPTF